MSIVNELVIWGYSLPPTDFYCSWLLRQARQAQLENLIIINPEVFSKRGEKIALGRAYIGKFLSILRGLKPNIFLYENFADYNNNFDVKEKYGISQ